MVCGLGCASNEAEMLSAQPGMEHMLDEFLSKPEHGSPKPQRGSCDHISLHRTMQLHNTTWAQ